MQNKRLVIASLLIISAVVLWMLDQNLAFQGNWLDKWDKIASIMLFILAIITLVFPFLQSGNAASPSTTHIEGISQFGKKNAVIGTARDVHVGDQIAESKNSPKSKGR